MNATTGIPAQPMTPCTRPLPERITFEELAAWMARGNNPIVEIQSIDMGYYLVRLHHAHGSSQLVDEHHHARRFTGTQWISRLLAPLGMTHGVLTWSEVTDEMIGLPATPGDSQDVLAYGTRVAFQTR
ncbi:hypothetical protein SAMN02745148_01283 [Modicisalibacter ilicicola DSM 19980]|uniref:Uncharacterized protein n=1 Tax=Modicisalibacter ilicicola DSM 19980 TaxID=1121942 RepID=A0A1M4X1C8_9GAMM|nr:DUF6482 family protein [Halomonas ilicicola]SHE87299.1 hypothetical protein SAMN02745148_01283 [Halomonas ilicicola DSM 19980]